MSYTIKKYAGFIEMVRMNNAVANIGGSGDQISRAQAMVVEWFANDFVDMFSKQDKKFNADEFREACKQ